MLTEVRGAKLIEEKVKRRQSRPNTNRHVGHYYTRCSDSPTSSENIAVIVRKFRRTVSEFRTAEQISDVVVSKCAQKHFKYKMGLSISKAGYVKGVRLK